ncbi:MAG: hypothetical protein QOI66_1995 [Myxococcales bacterium]|nr:hypothetical protein [Myxococcales bacterium]
MTLRLSQPPIKNAPGRRLSLGLSLLGVLLSVSRPGSAGAQTAEGGVANQVAQGKGSPPRATGVKRWERSLASGPAWTV